MENRKLLENKVKIRFQDCDPFNHLNNSEYVNYFFNAREDALIEAYDLDIYHHVKTTGKGWVVASNQISYVQSAFTMETVTIQSQLISFSPKSLAVESKMFDETKTKLKAIMWSRFVYFDMKQQKPTEHALELMDLFKEVLNPVKEGVFEDRIKSLLLRS